MKKIIVGVMRGGPSSEYDISLKTGQSVLQNLPEGYEGRDILVTKDGQWHIDGFEITPVNLQGKVDVIFNAMHGQYGEDGKVQQILELIKIPYTGSGPLASALAMNKVLTKDQFRAHGIKTPNAVVLDLSAKSKNFQGESLPEREGLSLEIFRKISPAWVVKPVAAGSSVGTTIVKHVKDLPEAIRKAREHGEQVLVEEYIRGKEATCGVVEKFRGHEHYALFPIEIVPPAKQFFNFQNKYDGTTAEHCPAISFSTVEKKAIQDMAVHIHKILGLRHYSRSDFIVSPRGLFALEANTLPGMTTESLLPKAIRAVGSSYNEFLKHVIDLAIAGV